MINAIYKSEKSILQNSNGITYDDVSIIPQYSDVGSRSGIDISTEVVKGIKINVPVLSANMSSVTDINSAISIWRNGGMPCFPRFFKNNTSRQNFYKEISELKKLNKENKICLSVGVNNYRDEIDPIIDIADIIIIDVAHGDSLKVHDTIDYIKSLCNIPIIAGNIATRHGAIRLIEKGVSAIKVGIGPGAVCTTRTTTGIGVPQLSAILECANGKQQTGNDDVKIIADGGIKYIGDISKAIAAGADSVMIGKLIAACSDSPAETINGKKLYYGSASQHQKLLNDSVGRNIEGVSTMIDTEQKTISSLFSEITDGLQSAFSYVGAININEFYDMAYFYKNSNASFHESLPHAKFL